MSSYKQIANHYKEKFNQFGATPQGLDWDNEENMNKRYQVMLDLTQGEENISLLDFGCGYGGFYNFLIKNQHHNFINYSGVDINENLIIKARELYPNGEFFQSDINRNTLDCDLFDMKMWDYVVMNGVFTVKQNLSQEEMIDFMCSALEKIWSKTNKGIAFNCMSKILDYERDDLFHVSFDQLSQWIYDNLSSKFTIRQDYGLREFTMYIYK